MIEGISNETCFNISKQLLLFYNYFSCKTKQSCSQKCKCLHPPPTPLPPPIRIEPECGSVYKHVKLALSRQIKDWEMKLFYCFLGTKITKTTKLN